MIRTAIGILAIFLLLGGAFLYLFQPEANPIVVGMMIRVGAMLGVIWLAFPQLESLKGRLPTILIAVAFVCLAVAAAKPSLGRVLITVVTVAISVGGLMKWMSKMTSGNPPRKK